MNIASVSSSLATTASTAVRATSSADVQSIESSGAQGDSVKLSKMGELMGQLKSLAESDPAKAKQVLSKISEALTAKADEAGDSKMAELAKKFADAAESGDMSVLEPPRRPPAGPPPSRTEAYAHHQQSGTNPMQTIESVISSALDSLN